MNVGKNISYPLLSQGMPKADVKKKVGEIAEILGITDILRKPVEPLGALDAEFREHMSEELRALHDRMNATTVYVTHDQLEAMQMGDKIVVMNHGVVEQFGVPQDIYDWPATMFVANFLGSPPMNFLTFSGMAGSGTNAVKLGDAEISIPTLRNGTSGDLALGVRPEHVRLSDAGSIRGEVLATEYLGTTQIVTVRTAFGDVKARIASEENIQTGITTGLDLDARTLTVFDAEKGSALLSEANEGVLNNG